MPPESQFQTPELSQPKKKNFLLWLFVLGLILIASAVATSYYVSRAVDNNLPQSEISPPTEEETKTPAPTGEKLSVIYPNGGESFSATNSAIEVNWTGGTNPYYGIFIIGDPAQPNCLIPGYEQVIGAASGEHSFIIEEAVMKRIIEGNTCRFKIKVQSGENPSSMSDVDQSDDYFTVTP